MARYGSSDEFTKLDSSSTKTVQTQRGVLFACVRSVDRVLIAGRFHEFAWRTRRGTFRCFEPLVRIGRAR